MAGSSRDINDSLLLKESATDLQDILGAEAINVGKVVFTVKQDGKTKQEPGCDSTLESLQSLSSEKEVKKSKLTPEQIAILEKSFQESNNLDLEKRKEIAEQLGLKPRQVSIWYQNRRSRWKARKMEDDYDGLKANYEALLTSYAAVKSDYDLLKCDYKDLLSDNTKLCEEVDHLNARIQQLLTEKNAPSPTKPFSTFMSEGQSRSPNQGRRDPQMLNLGNSNAVPQGCGDFVNANWMASSSQTDSREKVVFLRSNRNNKEKAQFTGLRRSTAIEDSLNSRSSNQSEISDVINSNRGAMTGSGDNQERENLIKSFHESRLAREMAAISQLPDLVELPDGNVRSSVSQRTDEDGTWGSIADALNGSFSEGFGEDLGSVPPKFWWDSN